MQDDTWPDRLAATGQRGAEAPAWLMPREHGAADVLARLGCTDLPHAPGWCAASWGAVCRTADRLAVALQHDGVRPGDAVSVTPGPGPLPLLAASALARAGAEVVWGEGGARVVDHATLAELLTDVPHDTSVHTLAPVPADAPALRGASQPPLRHADVVGQADAWVDAFDLGSRDVLLPLVPYASRTWCLANLWGAASGGYAVILLPGADPAQDGTLGATLKALRPTTLVGGDAAWQRIGPRVRDALKASGGVQGFLAGWALSVQAQSAPGAATGLQQRLARQAVLDPAMVRVGLDRLRVGVSTDRLSDDTLAALEALGLPVLPWPPA